MIKKGLNTLKNENQSKRLDTNNESSADIHAETKKKKKSYFSKNTTFN